jgi:hypothetical protein
VAGGSRRHDYTSPVWTSSRGVVRPVGVGCSVAVR